MPENRRTFIKNLLAISATAAEFSFIPKTINAKEVTLSKNRKGVLVDTTACIGCRKCEWACKKEHNLKHDKFENFNPGTISEVNRRPDYENLTVVNRIPNSDDTIKIQCMHCEEPACVSACIVGAITKNDLGAVTWDTSKCIGCRYCMVACPFQIPAFEYHKALDPKIVKCDFCVDRISNGKLPACSNICPTEALLYGDREELIKIAEQRIKNHPEKYYNHIFGKEEVGGTSFMYLAEKDLVDDVFPKLKNSPAPGVSESIQHGLFAYFIPPVAVYALLGGIMWLTKDRKNEE